MRRHWRRARRVLFPRLSSTPILGRAFRRATRASAYGVRMRVLVSGGAGYIGSHTVVHLTAAGHDVLVVDNFGNAKPAVMARLDALTDTHIPVHAFDLTDRDKTEHLFATEQIDAVVHFAGLKAVGESVQLPLDYYENNLRSTFSLLRAMRRHGCSTLVFSSSATVYGDQAPVPYREDYEPLPGQQPLRADQGDDRDGAARCRAHRPLVADRGPALLQPRRRAPVRRDRRGPAGDPEQPHAVHRAGRGGSSRPAARLRRRLPHDRRHLRARLHPRRGPRRRPCRGAQPDRGHRRADSHLEPRHRPRAPRCWSWSRRSNAPRDGRSPTTSSAAGPATCPAFWADPTRANDELGWVATRTVDDMCADTWRWQSQNPNGYEDEDSVRVTDA